MLLGSKYVVATQGPLDISAILADVPHGSVVHDGTVPAHVAPVPKGIGAPLAVEEAVLNAQKLSLYAELNHRELVARIAAHNLAERAAGDRPRRRRSATRTLGTVVTGVRSLLASVAAITWSRAL
jgi:hypothetical protein